MPDFVYIFGFIAAVLFAFWVGERAERICRRWTYRLVTGKFVCPECEDTGLLDYDVGEQPSDENGYAASIWQEGPCIYCDLGQKKGETT